MFGAIGRYLRAFGYLITGRVDAARDTLNRNPHVIRATYSRIVEEKAARINQYKDAVARMMAQEQKKLEGVRSLNEEVTKLERLKEGAAAKARQIISQLKAQGLGEDAIKKNAEYLKCLAAFNDFSSTLEEKLKRIEELEADLKGITESVGQHKVQLQSMVRELEKVKQEADATVADVITSREEEQIADILSGIGQDRTSQELQDLRELRTRAKAKSRISREMAGTDTAIQEAEFMEYARNSVATSEFDKLVGLASDTDRPAASSDGAQRQQDAKLPE